MSSTIIWTRSKQAWLKDQRLFSGSEQVLHIPTLQIEFEKIDLSPLISQKFDGVIFTSANAVKAVEIQPKATELVRECGNIIAFGKQTREALAAQNYEVNFFENAQTGKQLCEALNKEKGNHYLFIGAQNPATDFKAGLSNHRVSALSVYRTEILALSSQARSSIEASKGVVCLASPSAAEAFRTKPAKTLELVCVCIGPTTAKAAKKLFSEVYELESASLELLAEKAKVLAKR